MIAASPRLGVGQVIKSPAGAISLNASVPESVTLSLSASGVNFTLLAGKASNPGSTSVTATTTWTFSSNHNVTLYAYFSSSTAALTDGAGHNIPSSAFQISHNGGAWQGLTNSVAFGGANAGLNLGRSRANGTNRQGSRTDIMNFNINLTGGTLPQLPAATYTGTLTLQVQAL
ncbi:MAG TPA: hypothetical protein VMH85_15725 [Terriglobales bacterium]|nr:hypothetical protein [Terriglobales bacterium]